MKQRAADTTTIAATPKVFLNKQGVPVVIKLLAPEDHAGLKNMYLRFTQRATAGGLPPADDRACVRWVERLIGTGMNLIALGFDHTVIGHAVLLPMKQRTCELLIAVQPSFQKSGVGSRLLRSVIQFAAELNFHRIWLSVEKTNFVAIHLYTKLGFQRLTFSDSPQLEMALDLRRYRPAAQIKVRHVMNRDVIAIGQQALCAEAVELFLHHNVAAMPVITPSREVVGMLSQTDLLFKPHLQETVGTVATRQVVVLHQDCTVLKAVKLFQEKMLRCIPVVDRRKKLVGMLTRRDILAHFYRNYDRFVAP